MLKLLISVTANDILHGHRNSCTDCPVARAIQRAAKLANLRVIPNGCPNQIGVYKSGSADRLGQLPSIAALRIQMFDASGSLEPFSFELEFPSEN